MVAYGPLRHLPWVDDMQRWLVMVHWKKDRQSPGILADNLAKLTMALVKKLPPSLSIFGYYGFS